MEQAVAERYNVRFEIWVLRVEAVCDLLNHTALTPITSKLNLWVRIFRFELLQFDGTEAGCESSGWLLLERLDQNFGGKSLNGLLQTLNLEFSLMCMRKEIK